MIFTLNAPLLDFLILSVIEKGDAYGYQISQLLKKVSNAKDSTLYPVLRRLQENGWVQVYDQPYQGRNRRYYHITESGRLHQRELQREWKEFEEAIEEIVNGGKKP
ncbi:MAG: PadR family transcriptional regulator [Eubacteriales bacterium]|nr:PadR family transcriptional regulator [Eubacteriales bacterium]